MEGMINEDYLELVKKCVTNWIYRPYPPALSKHDENTLWNRGTYPRGIAQTMIGWWRLDCIRKSFEKCLDEGIEGDLVECGVWRGGAVIYMRSILKAYGITDRKVWACDSYAGLPPPDMGRYPQDEGDYHHTITDLNVSLEEVQHNFQTYDLMDDQVVFVKGFFVDTLPKMPVKKIAILRLDGDMYMSTMDILNNLYDKVSVGGYILVDDYTDLPNCKRAVDDFRESRGITDEIKMMPMTGVWWKKT
jgi:O-methyltransferase